MTTLQLQINTACADKTEVHQTDEATMLVTPPIDEDYWLFRVELSDKQAIVGFPKFGTIGVGFQHEEDWNTNLPYRLPAEKIYDHIAHNKGDDRITEERCIAAIRMVQNAAAKWARRKGN